MLLYISLQYVYINMSYFTRRQDHHSYYTSNKQDVLAKQKERQSSYFWFEDVQRSSWKEKNTWN